MAKKQIPRKSRKTKKQIMAEKRAIDMEYYSNKVMPGYVWAFLRAMAAKSPELYEHEYQYLNCVKSIFDKAVKINGPKNFCDMFRIQLDKLLKSMEDGYKPHLNIEPYLSSREKTPEGFKKINWTKQPIYKNVYAKVSNNKNRKRSSFNLLRKML